VVLPSSTLFQLAFLSFEAETGGISQPIMQRQTGADYQPKNPKYWSYIKPYTSQNILGIFLL
jgi:hypothetical protein